MKSGQFVDRICSTYEEDSLKAETSPSWMPTGDSE